MYLHGGKLVGSSAQKGQEVSGRGNGELGQNVSRLSFIKNNFNKIYFDVKLHSNISFNRGVHGHVLGPRPWAWAENTIEELMANVVGENITVIVIILHEILTGFE